VASSSAAIFTTGPFSGTNRNFIRALTQEFPALTFFVFDTSVLRAGIPFRPGDYLRAAAELAADFSGYLVRRPRSLRACVMRTDTALRARNSFARRLAAANGPFLFTLQTQTLLSAKLSGTPHFIYTDHAGRVTGTYPHHGRNEMWPEAWLSREAEIFKDADAVFTMGEHVQRALTRSYGLPAVECVHGGPNVSPEGAEPPRPVSEYSPPRVLFVGRRWREKGGPLLMKAFADVRRRIPEATLTIVGCSPRVAAPNVVIAGLLPASQLPAIYRRATIFCVPTRAEPMGCAFLEAMAFRVAAVGPRLGAIEYFLQERSTGLTFEPGNVEQLTACLLALAQDPALCKTVGDGAHDLVQRDYNWPRVAADVARGIRQRVAVAD
jgi:glycosyltransferase involved in cell wall biosynthesis